MTRKAKAESKLELSVPVVTCPKCHANCYSLSINMACEKCQEGYTVDYNMLFTELASLVLVKNEILDRYMDFLLSQKQDKNGIDQRESNNETSTSFPITYKGEALEALKKLKQDYNLPNLLFVIKFITEGFLNILTLMKSMPGDKFYLIDNLGNKSRELEKDILRTAYKSFYREKDKELVDLYLKSLSIDFKIKDVKDLERKDKNTDEKGDGSVKE